MPLSQTSPVITAGPDASTIFVGLGPETYTVSLADVANVIDGQRRDYEAIIAQLANILVGTFPTAAAVQAATPAQIQAVVSQAPFYW